MSSQRLYRARPTCRHVSLYRLGFCGLLWAWGMTSTAAPAADVDAVVKRFVQELVEITPGEGRFPGTFQFGPAPGIPVQMTRPFLISKYEVDQTLYETVMAENPSRWKGPRNSAEMMTYSEATQFCTKLTQLLRERKLIQPDQIVRLPTETEWEYCARAGTSTAYSFGDEAQRPTDRGNRATLLDPYAWHTGNAAGNDPPVGALKPNPWGLYDVHGYLWELCIDDWSSNLELSVTANGTPVRTDSSDVVIRGGSWKDAFPKLTSFSRRSFSKIARDDAVGFRCVLVKQ